MSSPTEDMNSSKSYSDMAASRFQSLIDKSAGKNNFEFELALGLQSLNTALKLSSAAIFNRVQRLHAKIDKIESKLG